jgi:hypothetical protein
MKATDKSTLKLITLPIKDMADLVTEMLQEE